MDTYTVDNEDVYTNTRVKRVIYTDYGADPHPTYGKYTFDENSDKEYQYTEIPLLDEDLVYTDGYGQEYRFPVKGTMNVVFDSPTITYKNLGRIPREGWPEKYEDYIVTQTFYTSDEGYLKHQSLYYLFDCDKTEYPLYYNTTDSDVEALDSNLQYDKKYQKFYFKEFPDILKDIENSGWISKSKSTNFNLSAYLRQKYASAVFSPRYCNDKFFVIGCCNNVYTISPIMESQAIRVVYNYTDFDLEKNPYVYITALNKSDVYTTKSLFVVEDLYYLNFYRFIFKVADCDEETGIYNPDMYTQICSLAENTAKKVYIRVDEDKKSWASAIKMNISNIGQSITENHGKSKSIKDWYHILIQDKSGVIRVCDEQKVSSEQPTKIVTVTEFEDWDSMMDDYNTGGAGNPKIIQYTTSNNESLVMVFDTWEAPNDYTTASLGNLFVIKRTGGEDIPPIPQRAFWEKVTLKEIVVTQNQIGAEAFAHCYNLSKITIYSDSVSQITLGDNIFSGCTNLKTVTLPNGLERIPYGTFQGCDSLTSVGFIPSSVTTINDCAFFNCDNLYNVYIPKKVEIISVSADNTLVRYGTFEYCTQLKTVIIPSSSNLRVIGDLCFAYCYLLEDITLPDGLETIGNAAFIYCTHLTSITIPASVTSIGDDAFTGCGIWRNRGRVICMGSEPPRIGYHAFGPYNNPSVTIYVPIQYENEYKEEWPHYANDIVGRPM